MKLLSFVDDFENEEESSQVERKNPEPGSSLILYSLFEALLTLIYALVKIKSIHDVGQDVYLLPEV